jgi:hypothetical protein
MKEPMSPQAMPMMGRDGGGAGTPGGMRTSAGITGKAGANVLPIYKPGTSGSIKPQPSIKTGNVKEGPSSRNPSLEKNINNFNANKTSPLRAKSEAKDNARGIKAANKDVVKPIMRRATEKTYGKNSNIQIVRGPIQVSKERAAKIRANNAKFRAEGR